VEKKTEKIVQPESPIDTKFIYGQDISLSKERQKEIVEYFRKQISDAKEHRKDKEAEWQENYDLLNNIRPAKSEPWAGATNTPLPMAAELNDTVFENVMDRYQNPNGIYNVNGLDEYSMQYEEDVEDFINARLELDPDEFKTIDKLVHRFVHDDTCVMLQTMELCDKPRLKWEKKGGVVGAVAGVADKVAGAFGAKTSFGYNLVKEYDEYVKPKTVVYAMEDVIVPIGAVDDVDKVPFVAFVDWKTKEDAKEKNFYTPNYYKNLDELDKVSPTDSRDAGTEQVNEIANLSGDNPSALPFICLYGKYDLDKTGERKDVYLVFEYSSGIFLRCSHLQTFHGGRPAISGSMIPVPGKWYGTSLTTILKPLQYEAEAINNQTLDNWNLCVNKVLKRVKGTKIKTSNGYVKPGMIVDVDNETDLTMLNLGTVDYNSLPLLNKIIGFENTRAGISPAYGGNTDSSDPRASGKKTGMLIAQSSLRVKIFVYRFNSMMEKRAKMIVSGFAQHGDKELDYRIWDYKTNSYVIKKLDRDVLQNGKFQYVLNGLSMAGSKDAEKQDELFLYDMLLKSPIFSQPPSVLAQFAPAQLRTLIENTRQLFRKYDKSQMERLVPNHEELLQSLEQTVMAKIEGELKQAAAQIMQQSKLSPGEQQLAMAGQGEQSGNNPASQSSPMQGMSQGQ